MKKSLLNLVMALGIGLFASCSQEEIISENENRVETVSVSAQLPGDAVQTRAIPEADANHKLRCILEVWNKTENTMIQRIEKLGNEATNGKLQFTFNVPSTTDYECLLWADFIASDATAADGKYTDKYYITTSLKAIDFVANADLFNNESADAFCGVVAKNGTVNNLSVTLKRPFTRVTLKDKGTYLEGVASLAPSFEAPSQFNVSTGNTVGYTTISATGIAPDATNKTLFSTFIFASTAQSKLEKDITIEFTKTEGGKETKTIAAGQITLDQNVKNDVTADYEAAGENVTVEVDIDDQYPDPNAMAVGHYYYSDGSWSSTYNANKTAIGIVFHVDAGKGDDIASYGNKAAAGSTIMGYVMALKSVGSTNRTVFTNVSDYTNLPAGDDSTTDFNGYKNTVDITGSTDFNYDNYPGFKAVNGTTGAPATGTSGWYLPSYAQMLEALGLYYGFSDKIAINDAFKTTVDEAVSATIGEGFVTGETTQNYLTSTLNAEKTNLNAPQMKWETSYSLNKATPKISTSLKGWVRPVLTVFKAAE